MKFTKEQAFENLKSLLTDGGKKPLRMSEKSINAQLDTLMPLLASDETELNDFVEKVKPTFETMNGNAEHDQAAFVADWNQKHPTPSPAPAPTPTPTPAPTPSPNEDMKKLQDEIEALKRHNEEQAEQLRVKTMTDAVRANLKNGNRNFDALLDVVLKGITIGKDDTVESLTKTYEGKYDEQYKLFYGDAPVPPVGGGAPPQGYKKGQFKGVVADLKERGYLTEEAGEE